MGYTDKAEKLWTSNSTAKTIGANQGGVVIIHINFHFDPLPSPPPVELPVLGNIHFKTQYACRVEWSAQSLLMKVEKKT